MINKVEDQLIGLIDAKYSKLEKKIQWLAHQGHSKAHICRMLGCSEYAVDQALLKDQKGTVDE